MKAGNPKGFFGVRGAGKPEIRAQKKDFRFSGSPNLIWMDYWAAATLMMWGLAPSYQ